jgi:segregation and condensation protein B
MEERMTQEHRETPVDEPPQATVEDTEPQSAEVKTPLDEQVAAPDEAASADAPAETESMEVPFEEDSWQEDTSETDDELADVGEDNENVEDSTESEDAGDEPAKTEVPDEIETADEAETVDEQPPTVESVVEAILFATDEPLTDGRLSTIVETTAKQVRDCIAALNEKYEQNHNAFRIEQIAGGYQMLTLSTYNSWLRKMLRARSDSKLSPAAMETLAIIAYKQPVIRVDIEAIRGVAVGEVIRSLMYKGLVKIVGRAEILGRPMLYGTTKKFLEVFGLNTLKDLPKVEELKKPD